MNQYFIEFGELKLPIEVTKRRTARRLIVRYLPLRSCVSLTLPKHVSIKRGIEFVEEKREWVRLQVQKFSAQKNFTHGQVIPVLGQDTRLEFVGGRGVVSEMDGVLQVHGAEEFMERRVKTWLQQKCKAEIAEMAKVYAEKIGVKISKISLRDTSSRWGSCSHDGNLSFSWRLIFAPKEVLHYVVAHEVAHIREHNHSQEFWKIVEFLSPDYKKCEHWLKKNGQSLYLYGSR